MFMVAWRFLGELGKSLNPSQLLVGLHADQVNFSHDQRIINCLLMLLRPW
jgi:hypothetical protein